MAEELNNSNNKDVPPPPRPTNDPTPSVPARPTKQEITYILSLLANLTLTSHALQALIKPIFGNTFGTMSFHGGTLFAFIVFSFALPDNIKQQRKALVVMSVLQVASAVAARSLGAVAAPLLLEEPTAAAAIIHSLLSFPTLGLGGAVWLHWTRKFMDPEPTMMGRLTIRVFTCVALVTIVKYVEPLIGDTVLQRVNIPPNATLICLAMTTYALSVIFKPNGSVSDVHQMSKFIAVLSLFVVTLAVTIPPRTPSALSVQYQRFTPDGFVQVVDNHFATPPTRLLRLDAYILGSAELKGDGTVGDAMGTANALLEGVTLAQGTTHKRALVIGIQAGAAAKSLISNFYDTTIVDARGPIITAVQNYFAPQLPDSGRAIVSDPAMWMRRYADEHTRRKDDEKFDVIVHDVFEGGELPARLFTMEFWSALRSVMDDRGVVAVNYVGKPNAVTFKSTLNMLRKNFQTCRAFHSGLVNQSPLTVPDEFTEVVIFCTPSDTLSFDVSNAQHHSVLSTLDKREVDITHVLQDISPERFLLKEDDPVMARWGKDGVNEYWRVMRERFPTSLWHSY